MVFGWNNGQTGGIKNRLKTKLKCLENLSDADLNTWAEARMKIIYQSYNNMCQFINGNLKESPDLYSLSVIAELLENQVSGIFKKLDPAGICGGKKKSNTKKRKSKKRKSKKRKSKKRKCKKDKKKK